MTTIQFKKVPIFKDAQWSDATATPGKEVTVSVNAQDLLPGQSVQFEIRNAAKHILALLDADGSQTAKWIVPMIPDVSAGGAEFLLSALLREKPTVANGHVSVQQRLEAKDSLKVKGTKISGLKADAWFVPKQENLLVKFKIEGVAPAKGRYEIWGERYPTNQPIYSEAFDPAPAVGDREWKKWSGKSNDGKKYLNSGAADAYLTPEFSPYRLRIILGPDEDAVKDPYTAGKGLGKVVVAETQFEILVHDVQIRVQKDLNEAWDDKYKLRNVLAIEKQADVQDGSYAVMGRLPKDKTDTEPVEKGRIRIPMATHWGPGQLFDQGNAANEQNTGVNLYVNKDYVVNASKKTKYAIDQGYYVRPELPLEFEVRLRSRKYEDVPEDNKKPGTFEPEALGPLRLEPFAEDGFQKSLYSGGDATYQTYWRNSVSKVKQGAHNDPKHNGSNKPAFDYWLARFDVQTDDQTDDALSFDVHEDPNEHRITDPSFAWVEGSAKDELIVYVNRTRLFLAETDDEFTKKQKDFQLIAPKTTKIKLQKGLIKKGDVLWIVRSVSAPALGTALPKWSAYPPGTNCHVHYGGIRGAAANNLWLKNYSASANYPPTPGTDKEPIIGKPARDAEFVNYKEKKYINIEPDPVAADKQERVEVELQVADPKKGLAGILFSPSSIAGDSYILHARVEHYPYRRGFGCVTSKPMREGKTGYLTVWRTMLVHSSLRLPDSVTVGLSAAVAAAGATLAKDAVGSTADAALAARAHPGDGRNMKFSLLNGHFKPAFNEWTMPPLVPVIGASNETPIKITAPEHGLQSGDVVWISGVPSNNAANGTFVVEVDDPKKFRLFKRWPDAGWGAPIEPIAADGELNPDGVAIFEPPAAVAISAASNETPIKITTGANHNLTTGNEVVVRDVKGNPAANGTFKVTVSGPKVFTLDGSDGSESGAYDSGGTVRRTNVTNTAPIRITTTADHGFSEGNEVAVIGAEGNLAANGVFKVHVIDARNIELTGSDGTTSAEYSGKGKVHRCGKLDCHRGVNLRTYANQYNGVGGLGKGKVSMDSVKDIQNEFTPFDHYRTYLPPDLPEFRVNVASNAIHLLRKGTSSEVAMQKVKEAIDAYVANPTDPALIAGASAYVGPPAAPPDLAAWPNFIGNALKSGDTQWAQIRARPKHQWDQKLNGGVSKIDRYSAGGVDDYDEWVDGKTNTIQTALENQLISPKPAAAQPKSMPVIRWPRLYHHGVWISGRCNTAGATQFRSKSSFTVGSASPGGKSRFESVTDEADSGTFTHEMGHTCHLSHFVVNGNDFNWKQHHLLSGDCLMSYDFCSGFIPRPAAAVGPNGGTNDTGWPNLVTPVAKITVNQAGGGGTNASQTIELSPNTANGGTLKYLGEDMPYNASTANVKAVFLAKGVADADVVCVGGPLGQNPITWTFQNGRANIKQPEFSLGTANLTGPAGFVIPLPSSLSKAPKDATYNSNDRTIAYVAPTAVGKPCAKCVMKLRGWNEEVLPCAWNHPDLF